MAKAKTMYQCQDCGATSPKWVGKCGGCGNWNTMIEETVAPGKAAAVQPGSRASAVLRIGDVQVDTASRVKTGIVEFDRVLGGGIVLGGVVLLGGDPGIGKSTLLMQALAAMATRGMRALYISGEESASQTAARARRLSGDSTAVDDVLILAESDLAVIEQAITDTKPHVIVLDSVQTARSGTLDSAAGTVSQLREVAARIVDRAKKDRIAAFLVGHVTKDGSLAGPKVLEHLVDTVLAFEGERGQALRTLRVQKNRFGSATEVGVFEMRETGLAEVPSPSALFLAERPKGLPGSAIAATCEGDRAMLVEVQALVSPADSGSGRRVARGVDGGRLAMLLAVLERSCGLVLGRADVFVNVVGGLRVDEPALDLAVALAVASSHTGRLVDADTVVYGEVGLAGEVRNVVRTELRLAEAEAMGFGRVVGPSSELGRISGGKPQKATRAGTRGPLAVEAVTRLADALDRVLR